MTNHEEVESTMHVENTMLAHVRDLPTMLRGVFDALQSSVDALDAGLCRSISRIYLTGCGDSHHAGLTTEMAFESMAGVATEPLTALQFGRYAAEFAPSGSLVIGISVSGSAARTAEALASGRRHGALTMAVTGGRGSRVARAAEHALFVDLPAFPDPSPNGAPGVRSYACNQLALFLLAVRLGEVRGRLSEAEGVRLRSELAALANAAEQTILYNETNARALAEELAGDAGAAGAVFLGAGPNYGTALFSAAKLIEACGDSAIGQDTEEWAHLQYYARAPSPTFLVSAGGRDLSRTREVAAAVTAIGRRIFPVMPRSAARAIGDAPGFVLPEGIPEMFSPLIAAIPAEMYAAHRAAAIGETYFRVGLGGDVSRIRTSEIV